MNLDCGLEESSAYDPTSATQPLSKTKILSLCNGAFHDIESIKTFSRCRRNDIISLTLRGDSSDATH